MIEGLGADRQGPRNIWLRAVLEDAERDVATTAAGRWRDVALVGAFRKGKQAERVSYETAIALAGHLGRGDDAGRCASAATRNKAPIAISPPCSPA